MDLYFPANLCPAIKLLYYKTTPAKGGNQGTAYKPCLFYQLDYFIEVIRSFYGGIAELALFFLMVVDRYIGVF
jgi:hypothetical protein